jgi:hypothetical protein
VQRGEIASKIIVYSGFQEQFYVEQCVKQEAYLGLVVSM